MFSCLVHARCLYFGVGQRVLLRADETVIDTTAVDALYNVGNLSRDAIFQLTAHGYSKNCRLRQHLAAYCTFFSSLYNTRVFLVYYIPPGLSCDELIVDIGLTHPMLRVTIVDVTSVQYFIDYFSLLY